MLKKNDRFIGKCVDLNEAGLGVVKHDNFAFFVKNCLIDEEVEVHVTSVKKSYGFGFVSRFIKISEHRVQPQCSVYKQCGGCQIQHMDYESQLLMKKRRVEACLKRIGKIDAHVEDCLGMENPTRYRNKVQVPVSNFNRDLKVGFYRNNTHDIVEYSDCIVQTKLQNEIVEKFKVWLKEENCARYFKHLLIKHAHNTGELMIVMIVNKYPFMNVEKIVDKCVKSFPQCKSIVVNLNNRDDNVVLGNKEFVVYGKQTIKEELDGRYFNISSKSFYQINPIQTKVLYNKAIELADIQKDDVVADVYCGTGTIGIFAAKYAKKVIGIEIVASAIADAKNNAMMNNVDNIEFICGDAGKSTQILAKKKQKVDVAIVDPPRKGLDHPTMDSLVLMAPKKIVYVSCDPATMARDVAYLSGKNYKVEHVQPVDMFAQTTHVESIILMTLQK